MVRINSVRKIVSFFEVGKRKDETYFESIPKGKARRKVHEITYFCYILKIRWSKFTMNRFKQIDIYKIIK